jgi:hypothetical protein
MKKIILSSLLFITLLFTIVSCSTKKSGFIYKPSCNPPCMLGIKPGFTSGLEAQNILYSSSYVDEQSIKGMSIVKKIWYPISYYYYWDFVDGSHGKAAVTGESKVELIELENININLNEYIRIYGEPSDLLIIPYWGYKTHVYVIYSDSGVVLDIYKTLSKNNVINLRSFDQIKSISYINKDLLYSTLHYFILGDIYEESPYEKIRKIIQPWKGYEKYKLIQFWE